MTEDELSLPYGISARISKAVVRQLKKEGIKAGLIRPITVSRSLMMLRELDFNQVKAS